MFLALGARASVYNLPEGGAFLLTEAHFESPGDFARFRHDAMAKSTPTASVREGWKVQFMRRIKHLFMVDLYYPNVFRLLWRATRRLARLGSGRVIVMSSSPPFSLALAGAILKTLYPQRVTLVIDMRDPWTLHLSLGGVKPIKRRIERWVLLRADHLTTVSFGLKQQFEETHGVTMGVLFNVASHYAQIAPGLPVDWRSLNPGIDINRIKLVYTGSTPVGYYDLAALVGAMKKLRSETPRSADRLQLVCVGACAELQREVERQQLVLGDIVFVPHVSHDMARRIQQSADVLLFLTYLGKGAVSTKIFEYLALGKPIFPVAVQRDSDLDRLLLRFGRSSLNLRTPAEIADGLARLPEPGGLACLPRATRPEELGSLLEDYRVFARELLNRIHSCSGL